MTVIIDLDATEWLDYEWQRSISLGVPKGRTGRSPQEPTYAGRAAASDKTYLGLHQYQQTAAQSGPSADNRVEAGDGEGGEAAYPRKD